MVTGPRKASVRAITSQESPQNAVGGRGHRAWLQGSLIHSRVVTPRPSLTRRWGPAPPHHVRCPLGLTPLL